MSSSEVLAYVGIGSNLGDARAHVEQAIAQLQQLPQTRFAAQSSLFQTAPVDADGDDYVNAVVSLHTRLSAPALLQELQALEDASGRARPYPNAPRTLDLDLLLFGKQTQSSDTLTLPHPGITQRAFVLIPLLQLDALIAIPGKGAAHQFVPQVAGQIIRKI